MCKRCGELRDVVTPAIAQAIADVDDTAAHMLGRLLLASANSREWNVDAMREEIESVVLDSHQNSRRDVLRVIAWLMVRLSAMKNRLIIEAEQQDDELGIVLEVDDERGGIHVRVKGEEERFVPVPDGVPPGIVAMQILEEYRHLLHSQHDYP